MSRTVFLEAHCTGPVDEYVINVNADL